MKRILIVDDEKESAEVFETALKAAGYDVVIATTGKEGLARATSEHFDGILLDQMLPDIPGAEMLKTIKSTESTKTTPVAILTNFGNDEMIKEALNSGASEYLLKYAISPDDLVGKVKAMVGE